MIEVMSSDRGPETHKRNASQHSLFKRNAILKYLSFFLRPFCVQMCVLRLQKHEKQKPKTVYKKVRIHFENYTRDESETRSCCSLTVEWVEWGV